MEANRDQVRRASCISWQLIGVHAEWIMGMADIFAAKAVGVEGARIAKTLSFKTPEGCMLILAAGDARIDNHKFKERFQMKAKMLTADEVLELVGHPVGGVCPFGCNEGVPVYLDESLRRFETVFPAVGSANSAIELNLDELYRYSKALDWVDVCKLPA